MGARDPMTASIFKDTSSGPSGGELGLYCEDVLELILAILEFNENYLERLEYHDVRLI